MDRDYEKMGIYDLRNYARLIGVKAPTTLTRDVLIEKIDEIIEGKAPKQNITKKGGLLLSVSSIGQLDVDVLSLQEAEIEAEKFAKDLGLKDMKSVWSTNLSGIAYVNLVPVINNVMIYPDMIKAKVSLDTGSILGWEAQSYAYNHDSRNDFEFLISEDNARSMVSVELNILSVKKCIIPKEYGSEQLCYEYKCTFNNYTYYVYISAKTGQEVETLRVVKTSSGNLLQ